MPFFIAFFFFTLLQFEDPNVVFSISTVWDPTAYRKFGMITNDGYISSQGIAPLTLNLTKPDPIFNDTFIPLTSSKKLSIAAALSNSFGFGGTNASLLFTKC